MKLQKTSCPLCGNANDFDRVYPQNFSVDDFSVSVFSARRLPDRIHYQLVKCQKCGMVRSNPIVDFSILSKLYTKSKFTYEGEVSNLRTSYLRAIDPVLKKLSKKATIVEVGCGNGFMLEALRKKNYMNVIGVEPSSDAIAKAPSSIRKKIKRSMFTPALFKKASVDFLFIFQTLDHIPKPQKFLKDVYTVLKPGGYMLSFHHNVESWSAQLLGERSPIFDVEHTQLFSHRTSQKMFEKAGFSTLSVISPTSDVSLKHLCWLFPFPKTIKEHFLTKENALTNWLSSFTLALKMGNTSIIGQKPYETKK